MAKTPRTPKPAPNTRNGPATGPGSGPGSDPGARAMKPPAGGVSVRMYRQGFGDCFLLAFDQGAGRPFYLMIDCGVVLKAADGKGKVGAVLDSIIAETGGRIDVLAISHEHWDHVSAFHHWQAKIKGSLQFGAVWAAWTDNPGDGLASDLRKRYETLAQSLRLALDRPGGAAALGARAVAIEDHLSFYGETTLNAAKKQFSKQSDSAMSFALSLTGRQPEFLQPQKLVDQDKCPAGVRVYVLGPPKQENLLRRADPKQGEAYFSDLSAGAAGFGRALAARADDEADGSRPFDAWLGVSAEDAKKRPEFASYFAPRDAWRNVDEAWVGYAEQLGLQMNTYTNNTSLALAFELVRSGKVLLFPGDAQVGNWISWWGLGAKDRADITASDAAAPMRFSVGVGASRLDADGDGQVTTSDLLGATVLYKVGHHGSHNGTLEGLGLECMNHAELIALAPVKHEDAVKSGWPKIPHPPLVKRLRERTRGRTLTCEPSEQPPSAAAPPPETRSRAEWAAFAGRVKVGPHDNLIGGSLYYEVDVV